VRAVDRPNDGGGAIILTWAPSPDDRGSAGRVTGYAILRAATVEGPYREIGLVKAGSTRFIDSIAEPGLCYFYKVVAMAGRLESDSLPVGPVSSTHQWINWDRWKLLCAGLILAAAIVYHLRAGARGKRYAMRELPGVAAIEDVISEAVSRKRPILFIAGSEDLNDIETVAGLTILDQVARKASERGGKLQVPHLHSLVMTTAADTLQGAYASGGKPETYAPDDNYYVSDEQFGFVAGVCGTMARDKPAACIYFGAFFAESLALAEMGQSIGAMQIAGTGQQAQIPFLMASCDHVLVGEELFAASAYLSRDPMQIGCLAGQDLGKLIAIGAIVLGSVVATLVALGAGGVFVTMQDAVNSLFETS
jgi:hypothetical protein